MIKLVALHKRSETSETYKKYYMDVHVPLALKLPGLRKFEVSSGDVATIEGDIDILLVSTLYFDDFGALDAAMKGPEGQALREDGAKFAKPGDMVAFVFEDAAA